MYDQLLPNRDSMFKLIRYALYLVILASMSGCQSTPEPKKEQEPAVQKREITIEVPKGNEISGKPCRNDKWTELPPPVEQTKPQAKE